jgi:hypothetical protein
MAVALGVSTAVAAVKAAEPPVAAFDLSDSKYAWKPWRDVAPRMPT